MENIKLAFTYNQKQQNFLSTILSYEEINNIAAAAIFGKNNLIGYQRRVENKHKDDIVKKLANENISPNSIILGMNQSVFNENVRYRNDLDFGTGQQFVSFDVNSLTNLKEDQRLRIIDGQHRIEAVKAYLEDNDEDDIKNMKFNVLIFVVNDNELEKEVDLFININSKAKRIRTDLAIMAKYNIEMQENSDKMNPISMLIIQTVILINSSENSKLFNSIRVDPNDTSGIGLVSVNVFLQSVGSIFKVMLTKGIYTDELKIMNDLKEKKEIKKLEHKIYELSVRLVKELFIPMWSDVFSKWPETVYQELQSNSTTEDNDGIKYFYNKNFYIQQTIGVKSLSYVMADCIKSNGDLGCASQEFATIIKDSKVTAADWAVPPYRVTGKDTQNPPRWTGAFKGMSSEAGFKIVKEMITGKIPIKE